MSQSAPRLPFACLQACSGGWDWSFYSTTMLRDGKTRSFSKGIAKSVYLSPMSGAVAVDHVVPLVFYLGAYPTQPLTDAAAGPWLVSTRVFMTNTAPASGTLTVTGSWGGSASVQVSLPTPSSNASAVVNITVPVGAVSLWWPVDVGAHPLYDVTATLTLASGECAPVCGRVRVWEHIGACMQMTACARACLRGSGDMLGGGVWPKGELHRRRRGARMCSRVGATRSPLPNAPPLTDTQAASSPPSAALVFARSTSSPRTTPCRRTLRVGTARQILQ